MSFVLPKGRPAIMGVLNITPDSFSDGGQFLDIELAIARAAEMMAQGADLIDVGAESTRPGAPEVSEEEEVRRLEPILPRLRELAIPFSIDTRKPAVASFAIDRGAVVLNDVSGLRDPQMIEVAARAGCYVCIMHMQGDPATMQKAPSYSNVVQEVKDFLAAQAQKAEEGGVARDRIWLDPGIGFGKRTSDNLALLNHLDQLVALGYPVLIGVSRKAYIGRILGSETEPAPLEERLPGALASQVLAQAKGARIIRTHDVKESVSAAKITTAILGT